MKTLPLPEAGLLSWYVSTCLPGFSLLSYTFDPETRVYMLHVEEEKKTEEKTS